MPIVRDWRPDKGWHVVGEGTQCRMISGNPKVRCKNQAVAALRRSNGYWHYCADHLYGREIRDGVVMVLKVIEVDGKRYE